MGRARGAFTRIARTGPGTVDEGAHLACPVVPIAPVHHRRGRRRKRSYRLGDDLGCGDSLTRSRRVLKAKDG